MRGRDVETVCMCACHVCHRWLCRVCAHVFIDTRGSNHCNSYKISSSNILHHRFAAAEHAVVSAGFHSHCRRYCICIRAIAAHTGAHLAFCAMLIHMTSVGILVGGPSLEYSRLSSGDSPSITVVHSRRRDTRDSWPTARSCGTDGHLAVAAPAALTTQRLPPGRSC